MKIRSQQAVLINFYEDFINFNSNSEKKGKFSSLLRNECHAVDPKLQE